jgi:TetR/AcrR family transcriptional regulator, cholesterol catabolism regulator
MNDELQNILSKVRELYMKYGIKSITMDDVARELAISKKTLYQYVNDKEDLVGKFIDNEIARRHNDICKCFKVGYNAIEELFEISMFMNKMIRRMNSTTEHDLKKYYPAHYEKTLKARREGIYDYILVNLKKGISEGLYRKELNKEVIAKLYLWRSENAHLDELFTVEEFTSIKHFIELLTYHVRGIATDKGILVLEKKIKELETDNK